jgi:hypothetical protein
MTSAHTALETGKEANEAGDQPASFFLNVLATLASFCSIALELRAATDSWPEENRRTRRTPRDLGHYPRVPRGVSSDVLRLEDFGYIGRMDKKPRRRWFQFSLRVMFISTTLFAVLTAWAGHRWRLAQEDDGLTTVQLPSWCFVRNEAIPFGTPADAMARIRAALPEGMFNVGESGTDSLDGGGAVGCNGTSTRSNPDIASPLVR